MDYYHISAVLLFLIALLKTGKNRLFSTKFNMHQSTHLGSPPPTGNSIKVLKRTHQKKKNLFCGLTCRTRNSGDNDFSSITALLKALHCWDESGTLLFIIVNSMVAYLRNITSPALRWNTKSYCPAHSPRYPQPFPVVWWRWGCSSCNWLVIVWCINVGLDQLAKPTQHSVSAMLTLGHGTRVCTQGSTVPIGILENRGPSLVARV